MAKLFQKRELRDKDHVFKDRRGAGKVLGQMLRGAYGREGGAVVLAIPAGGVPVGIEVSKALNCPLDLIITKKLPLPQNPEAGYGAVTLEGGRFLNEMLVSRFNIPPDVIEAHISRIKKELEERNSLFRGGHPLPDLTRGTAILVDDGLASGYTMMAAIEAAKKRGAQNIVVAVPTGPTGSIQRIRDRVDEIYCPNIRDRLYFAVADAYDEWYDLDDDEVMGLMEEARGNRRKPEMKA